MAEALDNGASLILFPEGRRNSTEANLLPFKTGIYHLAKARPDVELVPVWINNLNRVMPKGERVPIPMLCTVVFGSTMKLLPNETMEGFLSRTRQSLLDLADSSRPGGRSHRAFDLPMWERPPGRDSSNP